MYILSIKHPKIKNSRSHIVYVYCKIVNKGNTVIIMKQLKEQVEIIRQVFEYAEQFKDKIFVINIDSRIVSHPFFSILVKDIVLLKRMGIKIILVPGARIRIDEILDKFNIPWKYKNNIRISSQDSMPYIKMASFDVANKVMTMLAENKASAVIGNWVRARSIGIINGVDYKCAGRIDKLRTDIINKVLSEGLIPIFPNIGWSTNGTPYNISSNELALYLSREINAEKLFFVYGKMDMISDRKYAVPADLEQVFSINNEKIVSQLKTSEAEAFLKLNKDKKDDELISIIELAYNASKSGVKRVHIIDGKSEGVILKEIFSSRGSGIMIYADEYAHFRKMAHSDIPEVLGLMQPSVQKEMLVPRTMEMLEDRLDDYTVYEVDGIIHACAALHIYKDGKGEIAAVSVDETYSNINIGRRIIAYLLKQAREKKLKEVFVLTTQALDWFIELGFKKKDISVLPEEKREAYNFNRNSAVLVYKVK
jgi:amino-acid N-acetyltransferase